MPRVCDRERSTPMKVFPRPLPLPRMPTATGDLGQQSPRRRAAALLALFVWLRQARLSQDMQAVQCAPGASSRIGLSLACGGQGPTAHQIGPATDVQGQRQGFLQGLLLFIRRCSARPASTMRTRPTPSRRTPTRRPIERLFRPRSARRKQRYRPWRARLSTTTSTRCSKRAGPSEMPSARSYTQSGL